MGEEMQKRPAAENKGRFNVPTLKRAFCSSGTRKKLILAIYYLFWQLFKQSLDPIFV